jgi:hypothetical protein
LILPLWSAALRDLLNKVPEVTIYFWVIKILCTSVGETASDYLAGNGGLGLTKTTFITSALLIATLVEEASGGAADGSVSYRHDPMDAIEETLRDGDFHEIILSTLPHSVSRWLHVDLPHRVAHLGLPLTTVIAREQNRPAAVGEPLAESRG